MALSIKHQRFVEEYLQNSNATEAYQTVYPGVNRTTAASNGWRLLRTSRVAEAIQARLNQAAMPADEVLARITDHARADIDDFLDADGAFDLTKARRAKRTALLKKLKTKTTTRTVGEMEVQTVEVEFELHDAQAALVHLGKYYKLFVDRQEVTGKDGGPIEHDYRSELLRKLADLSKPGRTVFGETGGESTPGGTSADPELAGTD